MSEQLCEVQSAVWLFSTGKSLLTVPTLFSGKDTLLSSDNLMWFQCKKLDTEYVLNYRGVSHFKPSFLSNREKKGAFPGDSPLSSFPHFLLTAGSMFSGQPAQAWRGTCQRSGLNPSRPYSHPPGSVVWESVSVYAGLASRQVCSCLSYWQCWKKREGQRDENIIYTFTLKLSPLRTNVKIQHNLDLHHRNHTNTSSICPYKHHAR